MKEKLHKNSTATKGQKLKLIDMSSYSTIINSAKAMNKTAFKVHF